jgi:hypothetical protein
MNTRRDDYRDAVNFRTKGCCGHPNSPPAIAVSRIANP